MFAPLRTDFSNLAPPTSLPFKSAFVKSGPFKVSARQLTVPKYRSVEPSADEVRHTKIRHSQVSIRQICFRHEGTTKKRTIQPSMSHVSRF